MSLDLATWANALIQQLIEAEDWEALASLQGQIEYHNKYHSVSTFDPYPFQKKFYDSGNKYRYRFLMAGNRVD